MNVNFSESQGNMNVVCTQSVNIPTANILLPQTKNKFA